MKLKNIFLSIMFIICILTFSACNSNNTKNETQEISVNCISANGGTSEFSISNSTKFCLLAKNNADFGIEIEMQKRDLFGNWKDIDIHNENLINISDKNEIKIDNLELNKGTYKFQAHGSYGDNYNYDIKLSLIDN